MRLTPQQQYAKCLDVFRSWVNWSDKTDAVGLLMGLGDYYAEIRLLEDELSIPVNERFELSAYINW